jgi:hypothetical protein
MIADWPILAVLVGAVAVLFVLYRMERRYPMSVPTPSASSPAAPAARAILSITKDRLIKQSNGEVTATVGACPGLCRDDGSPAQAGDVLTVMNDGTYQSRPKGTNGWNERAVVSSLGLVYRPFIYDVLPDWAWIVPLVDKWPNGGQ